MFHFLCRFAFFINFLSFKPESENNANFDAISTRQHFNEVKFFLNMHLSSIGTHNLQTLKHNTLFNKLLLMQFYLINIRPKLHHRNWRKLRVVNMSTVTNFVDFTINAALHLTFIRKLCYKLSSIVTFTFIQIFFQNCAFFTEWHQSCRVCLIQRQNSRYFRRPVWKMKSWWKKENLHENWNMQTLFWRLLNISAKFHQNWSSQFWAIPFQSWCVFWDTVCSDSWQVTRLYSRVLMSK